MITRRNVTVPIYGYKLTIVIFDNWLDLEGIIPDKELSNPAKGLVLNDYGRGLVAIEYGQESTITHEAFHLVECIWNYIGYDSIEGNNEVGAYLITFLYEEIKKVYDKHIPK